METLQDAVKRFTPHPKFGYMPNRWRIPWWGRYLVDVPCGTTAGWEIDHITVALPATTHEWRIQYDHYQTGRPTPYGTYTRLCRTSAPPAVVMSDTPAEIEDHLPFIVEAKGNVLVAGLGIGMITRALLLNSEVTHVTVVEASESLIMLVGPHYQRQFGGRLTIVHADAYTWKPPTGTEYDCAWLDVWDTISAQNVPEMLRMKRHYMPYIAPCGVLPESWCYGQCLFAAKGPRGAQPLKRWVRRRDMALAFVQEEINHG